MAVPDPPNLRLAFDAGVERADTEPDPDPYRTAEHQRSRAALAVIKQALLEYQESTHTAVTDETLARIAREVRSGPSLDAAEGELLQETEARVHAEARAVQAALERAGVEARARAAA